LTSFYTATLKSLVAPTYHSSLAMHLRLLMKHLEGECGRAV
jgi:hypothetical protein